MEDVAVASKPVLKIDILFKSLPLGVTASLNLRAQAITVAEVFNHEGGEVGR